MAFRAWEPSHLSKFNSATSADFLEFYEAIIDGNIIAHGDKVSHKTFSGSSFRCNRLSWFRLRGTEPDRIKTPDRVMDFSAQIGTACHRVIQSNLSKALKDDWIDVKSYIQSIDFPYEYEVTTDESGFESQITIVDPPFRFSCDGVIRLKGNLYLLEIKTSEYNSWNDMTDPKQEHIDQVKCYATLLNLHDVIFLYQDRQYGEFKCYEYHVSDAAMDEIRYRIQYVVDMAKKNLAPDPLPKGDKWCSRSICPYFDKCAEYGR